MHQNAVLQVLSQKDETETVFQNLFSWYRYNNPPLTEFYVTMQTRTFF